MTDLVLLGRAHADASVAVLTLNRPEVMNCLSTALVRELRARLVDVSLDPSVRAIVLTGAGERAFSTGMDLKERATMTPQETSLQRRDLGSLLSYLQRIPKPVIAAVRGSAYAGGFETALCCDLIVASEDARFALPEVRVGIMPGGGGTHTLTWLVGPARARDLIFTGRALPAEEALSWGIVARVVPNDDVLAQAEALAAEIARGAPIGLRQAKMAIRRAHRSVAAALDDEDELYQAVLESEDRLEGMAAFAERRPPRFQGK